MLFYVFLSRVITQTWNSNFKFFGLILSHYLFLNRLNRFYRFHLFFFVIIFTFFIIFVWTLLNFRGLLFCLLNWLALWRISLLNLIGLLFLDRDLLHFFIRILILRRLFLFLNLSFVFLGILNRLFQRVGLFFLYNLFNLVFFRLVFL